MVKKLYGVLYGRFDMGVLEGKTQCSCVNCHRDAVCDAVIKDAEEDLRKTFKTPFVKVFRTREEADAFIKKEKLVQIAVRDLTRKGLMKGE